MTDLRLRQRLAEAVLIAEPTSGSVVPATYRVADAALAVFATWLREQAAWSAGEAERLSNADDFPDRQSIRDHSTAALVLAGRAEEISPAELA